MKKILLMTLMSSCFTLLLLAHKDMWQESRWMIYEYTLAIENNIWEIEDRINHVDEYLFADDREYIQQRIDRIRIYLHGNY